MLVWARLGHRDRRRICSMQKTSPASCGAVFRSGKLRRSFADVILAFFVVRAVKLSPYSGRLLLCGSDRLAGIIRTACAASFDRRILRGAVGIDLRHLFLLF